MSQRTTTYCDECGKDVPQNSGYRCRLVAGAALQIASASSEAFKNMAGFDLCGDDCATKVFSRYLSSGNCLPAKVARDPAY